MLDTRIRNIPFSGGGTSLRGMALFVTLVVVLILFVVIYQLWHCASLECRIAQNQGGYMKSALALNSIRSYATAIIKDDLYQDAEESGQLSYTQGASGGLGSEEGPEGTPEAPAGSSSEEAAGKGIGNVGESTAGSGLQGGFYDYENEALFKPRTQTVNGVEVKIEIKDGERAINLNRLFEYVDLWAFESSSVGEAGVAGEEGRDGASEAAGRGASSSNPGEAGVSKEEQDQLKQLLGSDFGLGQGETQEQWEEPEQREVEAAARMVGDLVIHMVESNIENGFVYEFQYDADTVARNIIDYVLTRKLDDAQGYIFSVNELLQVEGVTHELFHGPVPREVADRDLALSEGEEGFYRDKFGDIEYQYGFREETGFNSYLDGAGGYMDLEDLRGDLGISGSFNPGVTSLSGNPYPENEGGSGIWKPPRPIGLKHLFCAFSNGKVNLNTAPLEVIMALLQGGGRTGAWDNEEKLTLCRAIVDWRNEYTNEYLEELEQEEQGYVDEEETGYYGGGEVFTEGEEMYPDPYAAVETEDLRTNYYTSLENLKKIEFADVEEILKTGDVDSGRTETSPAQLLQKDLRKVACFRSEYFKVRCVAKGEGFRQEAEFVIHRNMEKEAASVVYYHESHD